MESQSELEVYSYIGVDGKRYEIAPCSLLAIEDLVSLFTLLGSFFDLHFKDTQGDKSFGQLYLDSSVLRLICRYVLICCDVEIDTLDINMVRELIWFTGQPDNPQPPILKLINNLP